MQMINPGFVVHRGAEPPKGVIVDIWKRRCLERNESVICAVVGSTGSGKTYTALSLACQLPHFHVDHIVFSLKDFVGLITKGKLKKGSVILYDESEIDADNTQWYTKFARYMGYVMATVRHRNFIILFTMPYLGDIVKKVRRLVHYTIECPGMKNYAKGYALVKISENKANHITGEMYGKYTRVQVGRSTYKVRWTRVYLPPKKITQYYEIQKQAFTDKLYDMMSTEMANEENVPDSRVLTPKQTVYYYMMLKYKPKNQREAQEAWRSLTNTNISTSELSSLKKAMRKKYYTLEEKPADYMASMEHKFIVARDEMVAGKKKYTEVLEGGGDYVPKEFA